MPATPNVMHQFDTVFEERLKAELQQIGLLDHDTNANPVLSELRIVSRLYHMYMYIRLSANPILTMYNPQQHWHLKNIVAHNTAMRG